ncbi:MAG: sugar transferase [Thermoleophilia bacterium]
MFDVTLAILTIALASVPMLLIAMMVKLSSHGPVLYWSERIGRDNNIFSMPKFRTMLIETPTVATHILETPNNYLTPIGGVLRKASLDELPQIWSILIGRMSFVGPRPALFNQTDLIDLRSESGVSKLVPGLTGWAQINGRDELPIPDKVQLDVEYMNNISLLMDMKILCFTLYNVLVRDGISH